MRACMRVLLVLFCTIMVGVLFSGCMMMGDMSYQQGRPDIYTLDTIQRVAVLPFADRDFTDLVIGALVNASKWDIYNRRDLSKVMQEQDLQQLPLFDKESAVQIGRLAGVQVVIFGNYDYPQVRLEAVSVETGKVLAYRNFNVGSYAVKDMRGQAAFVMQALLPYWIAFEDGQPVDARFGPLADSLADPELMPELQDALRSIRAKEDADAVEILTDLLVEEEGNGHVLNLLAWVLATSADNDVRDGARAVMLSKEALASGVGSASELTDTLAAALAATGAFKEAAEAQGKALALLGDGSESQRHVMERRLELYRAEKPIRR
ncbi:MAG: hypothetical protein ISS35_00605 [Kiritimatiellae bacterium]|nr:hypothetical protein [Kiritimatiellia bacterium]